MIPWPTDVNISRSEADLLGSTSNSSLISFAIGPVITMATVLFAVHASTKKARSAIPNSAPLLPLILLLIRFRMNWIPPCSFTSDTIHATMIEITVMSYIDVTPFPTTWNISESAICPMLTPTIREITIPLIKTTNTLIPISAPRRTTIYGRTSQRL